MLRPDSLVEACEHGTVKRMARSSAALRERLLSELRDLGRSDPSVLAAFAAVPRELFVADVAARQGLEAVYRDEALPAKTDDHGLWLSSSSQPSLMALMLEQLDLRAGHRVLEVGAGTGYNAALMRHIVGAKGRVTSIEIDRDLAARARRALRASGYRGQVILGDGRASFPRAGPYDRIVVTASTDAIPNAWIDQLRPGGRLALPVRLGSEAVSQAITTFELRDGTLRSVAMTWGGFLPLHGGDGGHQTPATSLQVTFRTKRKPKLLLWVSGGGVERPHRACFSTSPYRSRRHAESRSVPPARWESLSSRATAPAPPSRRSRTTSSPKASAQATRCYDRDGAGGGWSGTAPLRPHPSSIACSSNGTIFRVLLRPNFRSSRDMGEPKATRDSSSGGRALRR